MNGVEMVIAQRHGPHRLVTVTGSAITTVAGETLGAVVAMHDITERRAAEDELVRQAFEDALTGLPNRALLADRLGQDAARAERTFTPVWLMFLDLDNFKVINDTFSHAIGGRGADDRGRAARRRMGDAALGHRTRRSAAMLVQTPQGTAAERGGARSRSCVERPVV